MTLKPIEDLILENPDMPARNMALFFKRIPEIGMFLPCIDGVPVSEPPACYDLGEHGIMHEDYTVKEWEQEWRGYKAAKEKVLFEGFEVNKDNGVCVFIKYGLNELVYSKATEKIMFNYYHIDTLSDLSRFNLTLTPAGIKLLTNGE